MNEQHTERMKYITSVFLYGTAGMFLRQVSLPSEIVAMCNGLLGTLVILTYMRMKRKPFHREAIRRNAGLLLASGALLGLNWVFLYAAYVTTTVAIASLCNYTAPLIVVLLAPLVLKEKQNAKKLFCVLLAFLGILMVSGVFTGADTNLTGVLYGLLAAVSFAAFVFCNRKMEQMPALERAVIQLFVSAMTILPYVLYKNLGQEIRPDTPSLLVILVMGTLHTGIAYCLYFSGMEKLPIQTVAILGYLEPVTAVFCSAVFLREPMSIAGWAGAALVILAAVLSEMHPTLRR